MAKGSHQKIIVASAAILSVVVGYLLYRKYQNPELATIQGLSIKGMTEEPGPVNVTVTFKNTGNRPQDFAVVVWLMGGYYTPHGLKADTVSCAGIAPASGNFYGGNAPYFPDDFACVDGLLPGASSSITRSLYIPADDTVTDVYATLYPKNAVNMQPISSMTRTGVITHPIVVKGQILDVLVS